MAAGMEIAKLYASIGADVSDFNRAMKSVDGDLNGFQKGMAGVTGAIGTGLKIAAGVAITAVGGLAAGIASATLAAADMEQGIANIAASMQLTSGETEELKGLIMDLGLDPKLKVTATEAAQAIEVLGTAGLTMTEILDGAARSTVLLANSTGADFAQAGGIASDVMAQFNIKAADMAAAVDQITGVTVASKFTINDYELALAQAGGVAASVGISFEDFNAVIAATAPSFASGSDAGTSFKTFTQRLVPASNAATDAMKALGLITADGANQFFDASGQMKGMNEIAELLEGAFGGLSEAQKIEAASTIFGTDAMRTAFALAKGGGETIDEMKRIIGNTSAEDAAATRMDTLRGAWEIFTGVVETLKLGIGDHFLPVAEKLVEWVTGMAQEHGPKIIEWAGNFAAKLGELIDWIFDTTEEMGFMNTMWMLAEDAFAAIVGYVDSQLPVWGAVLGKWAKAGYEWLTQTAIPIAWDKLKEWTAQLIGWIGENLPGWVTALGKWAAAAWEWITKTAIPFAKTKLGEWGAALTGWLGQNLPGWGAKLGEWAAAAWEWITQTALPLAVQKIGEWAAGLTQSVSGNLPSWRQKLADWASAAWEWITQTAIPNALRQIGEWGISLTRWLADNLPDFIAGFVSWAAGLVDWIGDSTAGTITSFGDWLESIIAWGDTKGKGGSGFLGMIAVWVKMLWEWVQKELWPKLEPELAKLGAAIVAALTKIATALLKEIKDIAAAVVTQWGAGIAEKWEGFKSDVRTKWEYIRDLPKDAWEKFKEWGRNILEGLKAGIEEKWNGIKSYWEGLWNSLDRIVDDWIQPGSPSKTFTAYGKSLADGFKVGIESGTSGVHSAFDSLSSGLKTRANALGISLDGSLAAIASKITALQNHQNALAGLDAVAQQQVNNYNWPTNPPQVPQTPQVPNNTGSFLDTLATQGWGSLETITERFSQFAKDVASYAGSLSYDVAANAGLVGEGYRGAYTTLTDDKADTDSALVAALWALVNGLKNSPAGPQFNITQAPSSTGDASQDLANMVQYLNALYAS